MDGGIDSLVKWNEVAYEDDQDYWQWHFLQAMNEAFCSLLTPEYVSSGSYPCTRRILVWQHEKEGQCPWEDLKHEECGIHERNTTKQQVMMPIGAAYSAIVYCCLVSLSRCIEYFILLCGTWCCFCQAVSKFYVKQTVELVGSGLMVGKFTDSVDENKVILLTPRNSGASSCTSLLFPRYEPEPYNVAVRKDVNDSFYQSPSLIMVMINNATSRTGLGSQHKPTVKFFKRLTAASY